MRVLRVGLAQMRCQKGDWAGNLARAGVFLGQAAAAACDMVVLPEMALSGYCDPGRFPDAAQPADSAGMQAFVALTAEHGLAASGGFMERNPAGPPFISQVLADRGTRLGLYRKVHTAEDEVLHFAAGTETPVFRLPLAGRVVRCALAICADSDHPDLFATYARAGAEVVFHSSAPGLYDRRTDAASWRAGFEWYRDYLAARLPGYARAHGLPIVVATQTGSTVDEDFPGGSFVFGADGACLAATTGPAETLLVHDLLLPDAEDRADPGAVDGPTRGSL